MKNKLFLLMLIFTLCFSATPVLAATASGGANSNTDEVILDGGADLSCRDELLGKKFAEYLDYAFTAIMIATPFIAIILIIKDLVSAVMAGKDDDMKKAQSTAIKRIIIAVVIELTPVIVNTILNIIGRFTGTCGIG